MSGGPITLDLYLCNLADIDADGFVQCQPDYYGEHGGDALESCPPYGFYSRPLDPDTDQNGEISAGTPMLTCWEGGKGFCIPLTDKRSVAKLPALNKGESIQYGPAANFVRCHDEGTVTVFTTGDGTKTGQTIYQKWTPTQRFFLAPWGRESFDANGYHLFDRSGARLDMGAIAGLGDPLGTLVGSYARLVADSIRLGGKVISLGPKGGLGAAPVAKAGTTTLAALSAISAAFTAMAVPSAFLAPPGTAGGPVVLSPALRTALTSASSAIATAIADMPSTSTTVV